LQRLDADVGTRLSRLLAEEANLLAGIEWALAHDPAAALALLAGLGDFWFLADRPATGRDLLKRVLLTDTGQNCRERARAFRHAAYLASMLGDFAGTEPLADAARALAEQLDDAQTMAWAQVCQGAIFVSRGDVSHAKAAYSAALEQFESLSDAWGTVVCLTEIGIATLDWGEAVAARDCFERVGTIVDELHLPELYRAHYLVNLAETWRYLGQPEAAIAACIEALTLSRDAGKRSTISVAQMTLGRILLERGEPEEAASLVAASLGFFWEIGDKWNLAPALEAAAAIIVAGRHAEPAARLFGAANALREAMPWPIGILDRPWHAFQMAAMSSAIGEPAFTQAWTAGRTQSLEKSVSEARALLTARNS